MKLTCILVSLVFFSLLTRAAQNTCDSKLFSGFDSRLNPRVVGVLPTDEQPLVGFEIVHGDPVAAYPHRLLMYAKDSVFNAVSLDRIESISVDASQQIRLATPEGLKRVTRERPMPDSLVLPPQARLFNSGTQLMLTAIQKRSETRFVLSQPGGGAAGLLTFPGVLRIASWNAVGLSAIVDDRLLLWTYGERNINFVRQKGLEKVRDLCLVGEKRVVLATPQTLVLKTTDATLILLETRARCRWFNNALYVADETRGLIWAVEGLEAIGSREQDVEHARALVRARHNHVDADASEGYLEAARIVGCAQVQTWRSQVTNTEQR